MRPALHGSVWPPTSRRVGVGEYDAISAPHEPGTDTLMSRGVTLKAADNTLNAKVREDSMKEAEVTEQCRRLP